MSKIKVLAGFVSQRGQASLLGLQMDILTYFFLCVCPSLVALLFLIGTLVILD